MGVTDRMEHTGFFKTKAGRLTIAFVIVMLAFAVIVAGLSRSADALCILGLFMVVAALLYSPVEVHILKKKS